MRAFSSGLVTIDDLVRMTGLSRNRLYERLKRARRDREHLEPEAIPEPAPEGYPDKLPYVAITDDPARERGDWYEPESGHCSRDKGLVRIGDHCGTRLLVRALNAGIETEEPIKQYDPPLDGLKGGVDH